MIVKRKNMFFLSGKGFSYVIRISGEGYILHDYFGAQISPEPYCEEGRGWYCFQAAGEDGVCVDELRTEYPCYGHTDLGTPALMADRQPVLKYRSYEIISGKPAPKGLPSAVADGAETLVITAEDELLGVEVRLYYSVYTGEGALCRRTEITNLADAPLTLGAAYSASLAFSGSDYEEMHFAGSWGRERRPAFNTLTQGVYHIGNARGGSGHQINPFVIIKERGADEEHGDCYGFMLVYSGDHATEIEVDQRGRTRVHQGINPFGFRKTLVKGETFTSPECVLAYGCGLGSLSRAYHDFIRDKICRGEWSRRERPILINNWEATYMDFDEEKLMSIASLAAELGIELFVLDDGWFGKRDNDRRSLGDWVVNKSKIPSGIGGLAEKVNALGLKFGLWFEPEMVSPDSDLYRAHPDWAVRAQRSPALIRSQLVLDLTRPEVRKYVINAVCSMLDSANIEYVKWDMNRYITDMPREGFNYEYTLGLYEVMEAVTSSHPNVLFEGCSGGGGRFDAGILCYMPQIWTSDDTDPLERLYIQYGTSFGYPPLAMGSHVTESPNQHTGRRNSMDTRGAVSMSCNFGYELDITKLGMEDREEIKRQTALCRELRGLVAFGDFYRLLDPFSGNTGGWMSVEKDKSRAFVFVMRALFRPNSAPLRLRLKGLDPEARYRAGEAEYRGDMLMNRGIDIVFPFGDGASVRIMLKRI